MEKSPNDPLPVPRPTNTYTDREQVQPEAECSQVACWTVNKSVNGNGCAGNDEAIKEKELKLPPPSFKGGETAVAT